MSLADLKAIEDLLIEFTYAADEGEVADVAKLFAADASWESASTTWRGREAIAAGLTGFRERGASGPATGNRHIVTNCLTRMVGTERATAQSIFQLVGRDESGAAVLKAMGTYSDELVRTAEGWRIARRVIGR